jgi:hypothetical protein
MASSENRDKQGQTNAGDFGRCRNKALADLISQNDLSEFLDDCKKRMGCFDVDVDQDQAEAFERRLSTIDAFSATRRSR